MNMFSLRLNLLNPVKILLGSLIILAALSFFSDIAEARYHDHCTASGCDTIYVDPVDGKDKEKWDGSKSEPYETLQYAIDYLADDGDMGGSDATIHFIWGKDSTTNQYISHNGFSHNNGGTLTISGDPTYYNYTYARLFFSGVKDLIIEGFDFNGSSSGVNFWQTTSENITIQNCYFTNSGIIVAGAGVPGFYDKNNITIYDNHFEGGYVQIAKNTGDFVIDDNNFNLSTSSFPISIRLYDVEGSTTLPNITNNNSYNAGAFYTENSVLGDVSYNDFKNSSGSTDHGFHLVDTELENFTFNEFENFDHNLVIEYSSATTIDSISDNIFRYAGSDASVLLENTNVTSFVNNKFEKNIFASASGNIGIHLDKSNINTFSNNQFDEFDTAIYNKNSTISNLISNKFDLAVDGIGVFSTGAFSFLTNIEDNTFHTGGTTAGGAPTGGTGIQIANGGSSIFDSITKNLFREIEKGIVFEDTEGDFEYYFSGEAPSGTYPPDSAGQSNGTSITENDFSGLTGPSIALADVTVDYIEKNHFSTPYRLHTFLSNIESFDDNHLGVSYLASYSPANPHSQVSMSNITQITNNVMYCDPSGYGEGLLIKDSSVIPNIENNIISGCGEALMIQDSEVSLIQDNEFLHSEVGVSVESNSTVNKMDRNLFGAAIRGIYIDTSEVSGIYNSLFKPQTHACGSEENYHYGIYFNNNAAGATIAYNTFYNPYSYDAFIHADDALASGQLNIVNNVFDITDSTTASAYLAINVFDLNDLGQLDYNIYNRIDYPVYDSDLNQYYSFEATQTLGHETAGYSFDDTSGVIDTSSSSLELKTTGYGAAGINSGTSVSGVSTDFLGNPRSVCTAPDIGANENQYSDDVDGDGLCGDSTDYEVGGGSDSNSNSDSDTLSDYEEIYIYFTNPSHGDTDGDGMRDDWEVLYEEVDPNNPDDNLDDPDGDGLDNWEESSYNTDPGEADTDGDGLDDKWEIENQSSYGLNVDPTEEDADDNGINDGDEDEDEDGLTNLEEYALGTHAYDSDTDGDGVDDGTEVDMGSDPLVDDITDTDGDGYYDYEDSCPTEDSTGYDTDSDGCLDDTDSDGVTDDVDLCSGTTDYSTVDTDGCADDQRDTDGDGVYDDEDMFPTDSTEWVDTDLDGYGDNSDAFPENAMEWEDSDGDGYGDNYADAFPTDPTEWEDSDNDTIGDNSDACPTEDATGYDSDLDGCIDDTDGDGYGDDIDLCSGTTDYSTVDTDGCADDQRDTDGDGVYDNTDLCAGTTDYTTVDPTTGCSDSQTDTDGDTITDDIDACPTEDATGYDTDSDGCLDDTDSDGITDDVDICSGTTDYSTVDADGCADDQRDTDGDGYGDDIDLCSGTTDYSTVDTDGCADDQRDTDGDGYTDDIDAFPTDITEWTDTDGDGYGDNSDVFPTDTTEWLDSDSDTIGDNSDICPTEDATSYDTDSDGCIDDLDGDGLYADEEAIYGSSDSDTDSDDDGLDDYEEVYTHGTDPTTDDTDLDGMDDAWEIEYGFDPVATDESADDDDTDGFTNLEEYTLLMDPTAYTTIIHNGDDYNSSTYGTCSTSYDGTNISNDTSTYLEGSGSISFDIDVGLSTERYAFLNCSKSIPQDLSVYYTSGGIFKFWMYIPETTDLESITMLIGQDTSNWWGKGFYTFETGWNQFEIDWSSLTTSGSPDPTIIDFFQVRYVYTSHDYTDQTGVRFDAFIIE